MVRPLVLTLCLTLSAASLTAEELFEDVPVPGGTGALARALGLTAVPDRAQFVAELTRIAYAPDPEGSTEAFWRRLTGYLRSEMSIDAPSDTVPIPLSAGTWSAVLRRRVGRENLFTAVMGDRRAALLAHGLAALDDETLRFLERRPQLLIRLYERGAAAFAVFAGGFHIRNGTVAIPGGPAAIGLWEAATDQRIAHADDFIAELFGRDRGRLAHLYDGVASLDRPARAFVLGLWIDDVERRLDRFKALIRAFGALPGWTLPEHPFRRLADDPLVILARIRADATGRPNELSSRTLWSEVFGKGSSEDAPIDAAWIVESLLGEEPGVRSDRLDQFAFGMHMFRSTDAGARPDIVLALRAYPRYRMLMLTLGRMGIADPAVYAAAATQASRLSTLAGRTAFAGMSQFQGALAILVRLAETGLLDRATLEALVGSLAALPLNEQGRYGGAVASWLRDDLGAALGLGARELDERLIASLAGAAAVTANHPPVSLEGNTYRLDLIAPELRRLRGALARLGGPPVGDALELESAAAKLSDPSVTLDDIQSASDVLHRMTRREGLVDAIQDLSRIHTARDLTRAGRIAGTLRSVVDDVTAEALLAIAYALNAGNGTTFARGNLSLRHDFGFDRPSGEGRLRAPWVEPIERLQPGVPWHVTGSLLGLDLGLSALALRRISSATLPGAPVLGTNQRAVFTKTVTLMNAFALEDADRDAIAAAVERGRRRVRASLDDDTFAEVADEIKLDGWRRRAVRWSALNAPEQVLSFFSLTELLYLDRPSLEDLHAWGVAAAPHNGCLCTLLPPPGGMALLSGRWPSGAVATQVADVPLRIAMALAELRLPAGLAKGILAAATQEYVDGVKPLHPDDWLTLVRSAQAIPTSRIVDYAATLTAGGPLVPDGDADETDRRRP